MAEVAANRGLIRYAGDDPVSFACFMSTNYEGHFVLSLRRATTNEFQIILSESPAFRRSARSRMIEADLRSRIPDLRLKLD
jgi:hypothetical protein